MDHSQKMILYDLLPSLDLAVIIFVLIVLWPKAPVMKLFYLWSFFLMLNFFYSVQTNSPQIPVENHARR